MLPSTRLSRKVVFGSIFSSIACIIVYCAFLPPSMGFDAAERLSFWIRMMTVGVAADIIATSIIYRLYRPIKLALDAGASYSEEGYDCGPAIKALERIPNFLLWFGSSAYLAAGMVNLGLDFARKGFLDPGLSAARLLLAAAWGFLNGIVVARILNMILIEAKLALRIFDLGALMKDGRLRGASFRRKLMNSGLALFLFLIVYSGVVFYVRTRTSLDAAVGAAAELGARALAPEEARAALEALKSRLFAQTVPGGLGILAGLLLLAAALYFVILAELRVHFDDLLRQIARMAEGDRDLGRRVAVVSFDEIGRMSSAFNGILDGLAHTFGRVRSLTARVYEESEGIKRTSAAAKERAEGLARLAEETTASERDRAEELKRAIAAFGAVSTGIAASAERSTTEAREIEVAADGLRAMAESFAESGEEAAKAEAAFRALSESAEAGAEGISRSLSAAAEIDEAGSRVGGIASVIAELAERSNLLAMNASIEAAHAGNAGKGFGVVAREMKKLAESVAKSAKDIAAEVGAVQEKNHRAVLVIESLGKVFGELSSGIGATGQALSEISAGARKNAEEARGDLELIERLRGFTAEIVATSSSAKRSVESMEAAAGLLSSSQARSGEVNAALAGGVRSISLAFEELEGSLGAALAGVAALEAEVSSYRLG